MRDVRTSKRTSACERSSTGQRVISPLGKVLRDLRSTFEALGAPWYVFGAQAAIAYGVVRSTGDIDVTLRRTR